MRVNEEQEEEIEEKEDEEVTEDDDFTPYCNNFEGTFAFAQQSTGGPIICEPSNQPEMSFARSTVRAKSKGIKGLSEGHEDDSD
ncbi:hypothetical protein PVK06_011341 [Gossypium arboreum]|uniref:Uncharacterized protein n=1 Tax=Gossypium arboreum TaxID=29729 RepID=A0ABR0Q8Q3_GOSAR|nr:hypothetical protein PVK06_011341 [Gossypium arboreum]